MSLVQQMPGLLDALNGAMTPKFLATRSAAGVPNVVPVVSLLPAADAADTLFFGNFLLRKSIRNLKEDARLGILVMTQELQGWALTGDLVEFQRSGPYYEAQMASPLLRYNAYTGIRDAGVIRVRAVEAAFRISRLQVVWGFLLARLAAGRAARAAAGGVTMPLAARRELGRMAALKVLAWTGDDGYPTVAPALSLQPAGASALVCRNAGRLPANGAAVAANVLTLDAISYQAKGRWLGDGAIAVQEVYAGGPPIPGGRVA
ncbi:MAG TPA: pyridoxamine 5'-phosphate oxidase family protein [Anaerolineae bacterium]|nr:pyridoxamine 5'-phosphate oxidase family protein [Anaerolineae bacterium]HOQ98095.1 pyridoxamine 5'-phosphate oxidase family protein [Anaerolineae bacterium]HPL26806.1 pyridoxamine 5'-phosphate oxidase family protein [Anaerolineae bacterium]HPL26821.1 pyridoxamine 5'-phosphate oxidase family protein [Anaerolineae bacterium]